jgi:CubicO group peptidase (beta-lactamase class C family)
MKSSVKNISLLLVLLSAFALNLNGQISSESEAEIDKLFKAWDNKNSPGAAVGVVRDGRLIFSKGYGMADLEHDVPISPKSVFYIASVSKQFVTMSILLLEEQGKLNLDDEIQKYLPDFPKYKDPLTIRHFIHHTSGVRDNLTLWGLAGKDIYDHIDKDDMYRMIKRQKELNFKPGERYLYSNSCYFMLALIVEKVSGLSIRDFAEKHIFKPLGMKDTHFHDDQYHIVKDRVFSYLPSKNGFRNLIMRFDLVGSGGLYSNINDLFLWDQNFYNNKLGKGEARLVEKMQEDGLLNNGESSGYAYGLTNGTHHGLRTVGHSGALAGYRTYSVRYPDQKFSVIVLSNVANFNPGGKAREIAEIFLKDKFKKKPAIRKNNKPAESKKEPAKAPKIDLTAGQMNEVAADYWSAETGVFVKVFVKDGVLKFERRGNPAFTLEATNSTEFRVAGIPTDIRVRFEKGRTKQMFVTVNGGTPMPFKSYQPADYSVQDLAGFTGNYFSEEINTFYRFKVEDDNLILYINDQKIGPLNPIMKNLFINDQVGSFYLDEDSSNQISGFKLDAGRVRNLRFKKQ